MSPNKRKYELGKRAEQQAETRRRITEATVELHRTLGPAATHISEVARRAGVQRVTVYHHFPDESSLIAACSEHWRALHPRPTPEGWLAIADPRQRLRTGLGDLYRWYRETEAMTANLLRDAELVPTLRPYVERGFLTYKDEVCQVLTGHLDLRASRGERTSAAALAAVDFHFWRSLASLGDNDAAKLAAAFVELAADA
jgi:AcrR family transcriptional regulator